MPGAMDRCTVDGEVVRAQEGGFYGGWITARVVGPVQGRARLVGMVTPFAQEPAGCSERFRLRR